MTRIERIKQMETLMDQCLAVLEAKHYSKEELIAIAPTITQLEKYYTSKQWQRDYAADTAGRLPHNLKRGVLSEDGIWNLLETWQKAISDIDKIAEDIDEK